MNRNAIATLMLALLLPLAACKPDAASTTTPGATPASTPAAAQQASAEDPAKLEAARASVKAALDAAAKAPPPVAGTDYVVIANGQPFNPVAGKTEVVEFFGYVCPFCAAVQPMVAAWKQGLPEDVYMTYVPAPFGRMWDNYAKAFYTAEAMNLLDKTHDPMFRAIHIDKTLKGELGMDTPEQIAAFYAGYGADAGQFASTMNSFAIDAKVNRAKQMIPVWFGSDTPSTPTFIVAGKYRVKGKTIEDSFRIINQLVAMERGAASAPAAPAAPATPQN